ncbi:MAG: NAD-dependent epimerase [Acidobacteriota bacterium]|nr:NAD-dependent epimerase [Acidobacteriota bacterium]
MGKILVTGCAGFIGFHVCRRLLGEGREVCGLDNLNTYYDTGLKKARLEQIASHPGFRFIRADVADREKMREVFEAGKFDSVINLAAQAGVRHSLNDPYAYVDSNLGGFACILEGCRQTGVKHLVFASSSSVYGANASLPYSPHDPCGHPVSLYAATKRANELMAHSYSHLFRLPATGLRFFTVYGPWGRPDMALFLFTRAILEGKPIEAFNSGKMRRDYTYVDDVVEGIVRVLERIPQPDPNWNGNQPDLASSSAPYRIYNVGSGRPVDLLKLIAVLEACLGRKAIVNLAPLQPGDVASTAADVDDLLRDTGFKPSTPIEEGVDQFVSWYRAYYKVQGSHTRSA